MKKKYETILCWKLFVNKFLPSPKNEHTFETSIINTFSYFTLVANREFGALFIFALCARFASVNANLIIANGRRSHKLASARARRKLTRKSLRSFCDFLFSPWNEKCAFRLCLWKIYFCRARRYNHLLRRMPTCLSRASHKKKNCWKRKQRLTINWKFFRFAKS